MPSSTLSRSSISRAALLLVLWVPLFCQARDPLPAETEQVIQPELDRRQLRIPRIDTEDFEIGAYAGVLSMEDFGAELVYGGRLVYHMTESFFVEAMLGRSSVSDEAFRELGLPLFPSRDQELTYYGLSVGYNFLPGEIFIGRRRAMTSSLYLLAGVGNTNFINEDFFTVNIGVGIRILPVDWLALHLTLRDHMFESDILGTKEIKNNFELTLGLSAYF